MSAQRGYFAIGVYHAKDPTNIGTLWRSAHILGAAFVFTVGARYRKQPSDTTKAWRHLPLFNFASLDDLKAHLPYSCRLVGIELDSAARDLADYSHHERAVYLLGAEDHGLPPRVMSECHELVRLRGDYSMNVATAGSIVMYHRTALASPALARVA